MSFVTNPSGSIYADKVEGGAPPTNKYYAADANQVKQALFDIKNNLSGGLELPLIAPTVNGITLGTGSGGNIHNTAIGYQALNSNTTGYNNVAIGYQTLLGNLGGYQNMAIGESSQIYNVSGRDNTCMGAGTMMTNFSGSFNTAVGAGALSGVASGGLYFSPAQNTCIGWGAMGQYSDASYNVAIGVQAGYYLSGTYNTFVGYSAGFKDVALANYTASFASVLIGRSAKGVNGGINQIVIAGSGGIGEGSNTTVVGNSATISTHLYGLLTHSVVWDDVQGPAVQALVGLSAPTNEAYRDTPARMLFLRHDQNDELTFIYQLPHRWIRDTEVRVHAHVIPMVTPAVDQVVEMYYSYAWAHYNTELPASSSWTAATSTLTVPADGSKTFKEQIIPLAYTTPTGSKESSFLIIYVRRNSSAASDTYTTSKVGGTAAANVGILSVDAHYQTNKEGTPSDVPA